MRIVLEIKKDADPELVMAYLYKHTPLQSNFHVNLTCLVPPGYLDDEQGRKLPADAPPQPRRMGIKEVLGYFLDFRLEVVERRFEYQLAQLEARIHILEGFVTIFDALDELIKIIRASDGKEDAAAKIIKRFKLDEIQTEAILELKLYKLAKLEINVIREELGEKAAEAKKIQAILKSEDKLWAVIKDELKAVAARARHAAADQDRRRRRGDRVRRRRVHRRRGRQRRRHPRRLDQARARAQGSERRRGPARATRSPTCCRARPRRRSSSSPTAARRYVIKINDIAATTGYGDPAQKYFKFGDGERIVAAMTLDPRAMVPPTLLAIIAQRLRPAVRERRARRDHDEGRPALRQAGRGRRDPRRGRVQRRRRRRHARRATATSCSARPTRSPSSRAPVAASP